MAAYTIVLPRLRRRRAARRTTGFDVIVDSLRRTRLHALTVAVVVLAFGGLCVWFGLSDLDESTERGSRLLVASLGGPCLLLALVVVLRADALRSPANGRSFPVAVAAEDVGFMLDAIRACAPQALEGFSAENQQRYAELRAH